MNKTIDCTEGYNIPSESNELKIFIKRLIKEVEDLSKTTEATLLKHDGKIAELCKYVKDNLSNTLRCLVDTMLSSGELEEIIKEVLGFTKFYTHNTVLEMKYEAHNEEDIIKTLGYHSIGDGGNGLYKVRSRKYEDELDGTFLHLLENGLVAELIPENNTIYLKQFGAVGDGVEDDTEILKKFFKTTGYKRVVNKGVYKVTDTIFVKGKWREDSNDKFDNSVNHIIFENGTIHYQGPANKCVMFFYNHFGSVIENLCITRTSNNTYIDMSGVWHTKFINCDLKCDIGMNHDVSILKDTNATKSVHSIVFDNLHVIGNFKMNTKDIYINCVHIKNSFIYGNQLKEYALELRGSTGFQNIKLTDCDISYFTKALLKINDVNTGYGNVKFESCYFDTALPITEDSKFKGLRIDLINNFDASNVSKQLLYSEDYMKNFNIYNQNSNCNSLPISLMNLNYNGDFSYIGDNPKKTFISSDSRVTKTFVKTDSNNSGNALRLTYTDSEQGITLYNYGLKAPIKSNFTLAYRVVKRSGKGLLQVGNRGQYKNIDLSLIDNNKEFIIACSPLNQASYDVGDTLNGSFSLLRGENVILDIIEIIFVPGNVLMFNIPLHKDAKINPTADGTLIRPTKVEKGYCYFDTTLNKPIWWNGSNWVDSTGTKV